MRNNFGDTKYERKSNGSFIVDGIEVAHTLQCCHCGKHFVSFKGSGMIRGFCMKCMKTTCGSIKCDNCLPFERRLDLYEKGLINGF